MEKVIIKLKLDTIRENRIQEPVVMQHDYNSRFIEATFTVDGAVVPIVATAAVMINAKRSDGKSKSFPGEVNADGTVLVPIAQWMTELDDRVKCTISAVSVSPEQKLSTNPFTIRANASPNTTALPEEDTPEADILAEVLANENVRQAAEATRVSNETARKTAENSRQSAETQRLTDEATRVANEAQRVSAEASRDATFKGWARDIASLPSFDSRISANSDRITNIEAGIPSSLWAVDSAVKRVKDVPINARPRAVINKIGGMTRKCANLIDAPDVTLTSGGYIVAHRYPLPNPLPVGTYTLSFNAKNYVLGSSYWQFVFSNYNNETIADSGAQKVNESNTITVTISEEAKYCNLYCNSSNGGFFYNITINKGDTAKPYEPYFTGLRDAKVTGVKSVGANLIPFPYAEKTKTSNGLTFTANADGSIHVAGTATDNTSFYLIVETGAQRMPIKAGTYTAKLEGIAGIAGIALIIGITGVTEYVADDHEKSITVAKDNTYYAILRVLSGASINTTVYPMFNKGSTALPYAPYVERTLGIPEAVQALHGYGQGVSADYHNYIRYEEDGSVKFTKNVKEVDLSTISWKRAENSAVMYATFNSNTTVAGIGICATYDFVKGQAVANMPDKSIQINTNGRIYIKDSSLTSSSEISGTFIHALAAPEVTDISDLLPADNLIDVEGGGTITFENEYGYDMPNTVTYMLKEANA